jgi:hypothetical protein
MSSPVRATNPMGTVDKMQPAMGMKLKRNTQPAIQIGIMDCNSVNNEPKHNFEIGRRDTHVQRMMHSCVALQDD